MARTAGELLAGPVAPEQGRTAIIAWHGERIVTVPEAPGSQPGADVLMRVVDINDPTNPQVTILPAHTTGFHAHGYFKYGDFLYVGPHCLDASLNPCSGTGDVWADSLRIGGPGTTIGTSSLTRASLEGASGLAVGGINKSGTQSPWGAEDFWSYSPVGGDSFLAVRRPATEWIYDWSDGGARTGPAITATWDHLGQTGVIGFPFIMGNILVYAADMTGTGVCTYDISDPTNPVLLDVLKEENPGGYWPEVYGHYVFFPRRDGEGGVGSQAGFMVVDFSDPSDLRVVADRNLPGSNQYVTFQDEYAFMNNYKIDMRTYDVVLELATNDVTLDASQFALPVGNLVVTGGYGTLGPGLAIWAHQDDPDTRSPFVLYHVPEPDQTNYSVHCPITLSIPETLKTETIVNGVSLIVRPLGGDPIDTWHSFGQGKLLTVTPQQVLEPNTTYEVILTSGIEDAAGNGLEPYTFRFSTGSNLGGGNQPPSVDSIASTPTVAEPGVPVQIDWTGSDPELGPIDYRIDLGDGTPRTDWDPATTINHTFTDAGHYRITVQARDDQGAISALSYTITVVNSPTAGQSTASSQLALDAANERLFVANPDNNTVTAIDSDTLVKLWETPVGRHPSSVALASDGTVWAVCRDADQIDILDGATGAILETIPLEYGERPVAIAATPDATTLLVSCEASGMLRRFSAATRTETGALAVGPSPRAIAITHDATRALVTRFVSGEDNGSVYDVDLSGGMSLTRTILLRRDHTSDGSASGRGVPNYLAGIRISPDGLWVWVVGKKDNTTRGTYFSALQPLGQDNTVRAQLMLIDLTSNVEDTTRRLDIDNSDSPSAIAFSPMGDYAFIALQGNAQVAVIDVLDFMPQENPGTVYARWATGLAPQALLLDDATGRIFTRDLMDRTVTALEAGPFITGGVVNIASSAIPTVASELMHPEVLLGKQIFYHASDPRMSAEGYISCATCHVDGGHDGRTFDFTNRGEGFRNTVDLRGRSGTGHGDVHWSANFDEIQDFENDIRNGFGGTGFLTDGQFASVSDTLGAPKAGLNADLDALAAYVTSLGSASVPRSPHRASDGSLTAAALAGEALFNTHNCASCHVPATDYTDRMRHDVGTMRHSSGQRLGGVLDGIDTPTLLGVYDSAPYFHDGSAATLEEVFTLTGGRLAQAEDGIVSGSVAPNDIGWLAMKDWHQTGFVEFGGAGTLTFDDVETTLAGDGYIEIRYNAAYAFVPIDVSVNGDVTADVLPTTPNVPNWQPNEWRRRRIPVTYQAGTNTVEISFAGAGGYLLIDDILFSTPEDAANASAHVRGFDSTELASIVAYLGSLDGADAVVGDVVVMRDTVPIAPSSTDAVEVPGPGDLALIYTIENNGAGPLNLGTFHLVSNPEGDIWIETQPAPHVEPGQSTTVEIRASVPTGTSTATIEAWTDDPDSDTLQWMIETTPAPSDVKDYYLY